MATEGQPLYNFYFRYKWNEVDFAAWQSAMIGMLRDSMGSIFGSFLVSGGTVTPGSGLSVTIAAYIANGDDGYLHVKNSATTNLALATAHASLGRRDLIVARKLIVDDTNISRPTSPFDTVPLKELQKTQVVVITGTPASTPVYPSKTAHDVIIAGVLVPATATTVSANNIDTSVTETYALRDPTLIAAKHALGNVATREMLSRTSAESNQWHSVAWSPQLRLYAAVAVNGTHRVQTSPDGINWTAQTAAAANTWTSIAWSPTLGKFVATGLDGSSHCAFMYSSDGATWSSGTPDGNNAGQDVCWASGLGKFVCVGAGGEVQVSTDGINWTKHTCVSPVTSWRSVTWSQELGLLVAAGFGEFMTSPDGTTWTSRTSAVADQLEFTTWVSELGLFINTTANNTNGVQISADGINWSALTIPSPGGGLQQAVWSPEFRMMIAFRQSSAKLWSSFDGVNWYQYSAMPVSTGWFGGCWSPELSQFVVVSSGGQVATSH